MAYRSYAIDGRHVRVYAECLKRDPFSMSQSHEVTLWAEAYFHASWLGLRLEGFTPQP